MLRRKLLTLGFISFLLLSRMLSASPAVESLTVKRLESRLEEELQKLKIEVLQPGFRCLLLSEGESPLQQSVSIALQWDSLGIGPLLRKGVIKEIEKPFQYSINSQVYQQPAGCGIDFSLSPARSYGAVWQGDSEYGFFIREEETLYRWGGWFSFDIGQKILLEPWICELLQASAFDYLGLSVDQEEDQEADEEVEAGQPLQTNSMNSMHSQRIHTFGVNMIVREGRQECRLLVAFMYSAAGKPSSFFRSYINLHSAGRFDWQLSMLGRWIGEGFENSKGVLPQKKASLSGLAGVSFGRSGLSIHGEISRNRLPVVPLRYVECEREVGGKVYTGFSFFDCNSSFSHNWDFNEEGQLAGKYKQDVNLSLRPSGWNCKFRFASLFPYTSVAEHSAKLEAGTSVGCVSMSASGKLTWEQDLNREAIDSWSVALRGEYTRRADDVVELWAKLVCEGNLSGRVAFPLSLGMKIESTRP
ncbi:MAG: hypothetical protein U5P10_16275 [Spirochaetia bacterium]|nr:hypothetical protein [Spirochaetia bacterium]